MKPPLPKFQQIVWEYYRQHGRQMPWRTDPSPYNVLISEVMLQQTQVARVLEKYPLFLGVFPTLQALAAAPRVEVLAVWQGLGYNRRALYLQRAAQLIMQHHQGIIPDNPAILVQLPGIGPNTAGSIVVFAYSRPVVFIETNIRRVFLHHFFADHQAVPDSDLLPLIEATIDSQNPRQWYYALMDYGAHLAKTVPNPNQRSKHYTRQSPFVGSDRQIRGAVIRLLLEFPVLTADDIVRRFPEEPPERVVRILDQLTKEGFLFQQK